VYLKLNKLESITGMDMSNDEKFLLLSSLKSKIFLFDRDTGEVITSYSGKHTVQNYASMVKFSKNNKTVITPSESHSIALYDLVNVNKVKLLIL
jgi:WD40 repeat protein